MIGTTTTSTTTGTIEAVRGNLRAVIRGKDEKIDLLLAAMLAEGHVLIEDVPGLGKTTLAKALARSISGAYRRVQFTPDLLPTDVLGGSVYNPSDGSFTLHRGPIFTNILLADEINRASPRTQSALLEAMAERQVTVDGRDHELPGLFMVLATQNPIEFHGTYPLPEAQLDRFLVRMTLGYADAETERRVLFDQAQRHPLADLEAAVDTEAVAGLRAEARRVHVADEVGAYIVDLVRATREHERVRMGAGPRGAIGVFRMARARALMAGRDHALPDDVQAVAEPVLAHRMVLEPGARHAGADGASVVEDVMGVVAVPT